MMDEIVDTLEINDEAPPELAHSFLSGIVRGVFSGIDATGMALVDFARNPNDEPIAAATVVALTRADIGKTVMLAFEAGDPALPVIVGLVKAVAVVEAQGEPATNAVIDGERLVLSASQEVVLRCGDASLTLTRSGSVLIRGLYVLSRSRGVNRIKGGTVHVN